MLAMVKYVKISECEHLCLAHDGFRVSKSRVFGEQRSQTDVDDGIRAFCQDLVTQRQHETNLVVEVVHKQHVFIGDLVQRELEFTPHHGLSESFSFRENRLVAMLALVLGQTAQTEGKLSREEPANVKAKDLGMRSVEEAAALVGCKYIASYGFEAQVKGDYICLMPERFAVVCFAMKYDDAGATLYFPRGKAVTTYRHVSEAMSRGCNRKVVASFRVTMQDLAAPANLAEEASLKLAHLRA